MASDNSQHSPMISRRNALKASASSGALAISTLAGCLGGGRGGGSSGPIKIGEVFSRTGSIGLYGVPQHKVGQLAVKELNENGGILDRDVELISKDPQSDIQKFQDQTRELIQGEQVDLLYGGDTSASREAIRPIANENQQLYFFPSLYEGGVCDEYTYLMGPVPYQQLRPLVPYMIEKYGPDCYALLADYNYGHTSQYWNEQFLNDNGGNLVGEEAIPLGVSDFGSTIDRISNKDPDWIMSFLVGSNHASYFKQAASRGINKPMASSVNIAAGYEHKSIAPPALSGMVSAWNYYEELPTERNQQFVERVRNEYPDLAYLNQHAVAFYNTVKFYAKAVEEAGTTEQPEVNKVLESGISLESPQGDVQIDPETHHLSHTIYLSRVQDDHSLEFLNETENVGPYKDVQPKWLQERCSLASESTWDDPTSKQFQPDSSE